MTLQFKSIEKVNPRDVAAPKKHYASAVSRGTTSLKQLAALLGDGSTTRMADVYAVLIGLVEEIKKELRAGRSVHLGDLGSFSVRLKSNGVTTPEEVISSIIKGNRLNYRPSQELNDMLKTIKYVKVI